ncbi:MAG TPA: hypothetical protein VKT77_17960 [Chthonomonadaceae bacterium]|nr:hypothetical protein [Chthonomonadaceae bacterium]
MNFEHNSIDAELPQCIFEVVNGRFAEKALDLYGNPPVRLFGRNWQLGAQVDVGLALSDGQTIPVMRYSPAVLY